MDTAFNASQEGNITTYNRFQCLAEATDCLDDDVSVLHAPDSQDASTSASSSACADDPNSHNLNSDSSSSNHARLPKNTNYTEKKPPPIYLAIGIKDYAAFSKILQESVGDKFQMKFLGKQVKIRFENIIDFTHFKQYAIAHKFRFHTFASQRKDYHRYAKRLTYT